MTTNVNDIIKRGMGESYLLKHNLEKYSRSESLSPRFIKKTDLICNKICGKISPIDNLISQQTGFGEAKFSEIGQSVREVMRGFFRGKDIKEIYDTVKEYHQDVREMVRVDDELMNVITTASQKAKAVIFTGTATALGYGALGYSSFKIANAFLNTTPIGLGVGVAYIIGSILTQIFTTQFWIWIKRKGNKQIDKDAADAKARECLEVVKTFKEKWQPKLQEIAAKGTVSRSLLNEIAYCLEYTNDAEIEFKEYLKEPSSESFVSNIKATLGNWFGYGSKEELKARYEEMEKDVLTTKVIKNAYIEETLTTSKKIVDVAMDYLKSVAASGIYLNSPSSSLLGITAAITSVFFFVRAVTKAFRKKKVLPGRLEEIEKIFTDLKEKYDATYMQLREENKRVPMEMNIFRDKLGKILGEISREKYDRSQIDDRILYH